MQTTLKTKTNLPIEAECAVLAETEPSGERRRRLHIRAYTGGLLRVSGWSLPVVVDLGKVTFKPVIPILLGHSPDVYSVVGQTSAVRVEGRSIYAEADVLGSSDSVRRMLALADQGFAWQASIGLDVSASRLVPEGESETVNGVTFKGPLWVVGGELREVSVVVIGADNRTQVLVASRRDVMSDEKLEYSDAEQAQALQQQPEKPNSGAADDLVASIRASALAEVNRINRIRELCAGKHSEIEAKAITEGWDENQTRAELLKASRVRGALGLVRQEPELSRDVVVAALAMGAGVAEQHLNYDDRVMTRARELRRKGFRWIVEHYAEAHGVILQGSPGSTDWIRAAFSTRDFGGIIGDVANKALAAGFNAVSATVPKIAASVSHSNFHSHQVFSLALGGDLEPVSPEGELRHLTVGHEFWTRKLDTRGALLAITRQDIVNDSLGALTSAAMRLGRKAVISRERAMYQLINSTGNGTSHFTAARKNYFEGADSALTVDGLSKAVQMFRDQTGPDGKDLISIEPRILLVPSSLEERAKALMDRTALLIATGMAASEKVRPAVNIWAGSFEVVPSSWLNNPAISGSQTAWYLIADPNDVPAFEVAYLNGMDQPTVEYHGLDANPNVLGVTYRVYWDFGVALAEFRAGVKSKGA